MAAVIAAKVVKGKKILYVWGENHGRKWRRDYPQCQSKSDLYNVLREQLALPSASSRQDVVVALLGKTWTGTRWEDDFSLRLKSLREQAGLTQVALANKAGVSPQAIAALEQGTRGPTWETVRRLALALAVSEDQFNAHLPPEEKAKALASEEG
jgi:DNA-binding XRE family transcriptional regulator